jgi:hypothetical protein
MAKLKNVVDQLLAEGYLQPEDQAGVAEAVAAEELGTAWYIQAAMGISAWIAAIFIIGFIVTGVILTESAVAYIIAGLIFCGAAVGVKRFFPRSIFAGQLTLAVSLAGQGLLVAGFYLGSESLVVTCLLTILMEVALIFLYPSRLHRFISSLAILIALLILIYGEWELYEATHVLVFLLAGLALAIWYGDSWAASRDLQELTRPVGYAAVITLLGLLLPSIILGIDFVEHWWISTLLILILFLGLIFLIARSGGMALSPIVIGAMAGAGVVLSLLTWQTPGILASLTMLLLGFWRGQRLVLGLAVAFLAFFIGAYYYNLDLTLYEKSLILMGTGALLFLARYMLLRWLEPVREVI